MLNFFVLIPLTFFYVLSEFQINLPQATFWTQILKSMWETMECKRAPVVKTFKIAAIFHCF